MALFRRNNKKDTLNESSNKTQMNMSDLFNLPYYNFITSLSTFRLNAARTLSSEIKKSMLEDATISMIINMWISDALHKDVLTHEIFTVDVAKLEDDIDDDTINRLNDSIDYLLTNSNILDILPQVLYRIITDGVVSVRFGFVDKYEDTKVKLFESSGHKLFESDGGKVLSEADEHYFSDFGDDVKSSLDNSTSEYTYSNLSVDKMSKLKKSKLVGRYFFEVLPSSLVPFTNKGITVFYLDLDNTVKILNPRNITTFINSRGNTKTISVKANPDDIVSTQYEIPLGQSFIDKAVTPWSMLNTVEDCTLLALLTRSSIYRLFQIDVGAMSTKETDNLILEFKKRLTTRETVDVRKDYYSSAQTQIPLGDSIIVPTRNGVGAINVQAIGGDMDIKTQEPLDYFREQLLGSLGVPKTLIYGDESGQLINTSAARQDVRYLRTIQQFTSILSQGIEDIVLQYLDLLGVDHTKVDIHVVFAEINNQDALDRIEFEQAKQDALDRAITSLNNLGISFEDGKYSGVRNLLVTRYLDAELLDKITEDEGKDMQNLVPSDEEPSQDEEGGEHESLPPGTDFNNPIDVNLNGGPEDTGTEAGEETNDEGLLPLPDEEPAPSGGTPADTTLGEV